MDICFLGQQSWMISDGCTNIMVDPLLTESFGTTQNLQFRVYPPRHIDISKLPDIDAVFITNEHLDHFHLKSLKILNKSVPIYIGTMMPNIIKDTIRALGFKLFELCNGETVQISSLKARFYIGNADVPFWEKRVYQLYVTDHLDYGVFIQSDTLLSELFVERLNSGVESQPKVLIATNNAQLLPVDSAGAFDNMLPLEDSSKTGLPGLDVLYDVLISYAEGFGNLSHILMSGGGYIIDRAGSKPFLFTDYEIVNSHLKELSLGLNAMYMTPGEKIEVSHDDYSINHVNWIHLNKLLYNEYKLRSAQIDSDPDFSLTSPIFPEKLFSNELARSSFIENELMDMARLILLSDFGRLILATNQYLDGDLEEYRFIIVFKTELGKELQYVLNINAAKFERLSKNVDNALHIFPYGIELFVSDFIALLEGKIQIWELATSNLRQWYLGDKMTSPVAFLYSYFSEQVRQDLTQKVYDTIDSW